MWALGLTQRPDHCAGVTSAAHRPTAKGLASHCTSWGGCGTSLVVLAGFRWPAALFDRCDGGDVVEVGAFVVGLFGVEQALVVPAFDGVGADSEAGGGLGQWEQAAGLQALRV